MKDENSAHSYSEGSEVPPDNETVEDGGGCYVAGSREETIQEMDDKFADAAKKSIANAKEYKMKEQDAAHSFKTAEEIYSIHIPDGWFDEHQRKIIIKTMNEYVQGLTTVYKYKRIETLHKINMQQLAELTRLRSELQQERDRIRALQQTLIARFYNDRTFNKDSLSKIIDEVGDLLK